MADRLFIRGLRVDCIIGRAEWERMVKQTVDIGLAVDIDTCLVVQKDDVGDSLLNTKELSKRLQSYTGSTAFFLIETLAERISEVILTEFPVNRLKLRVSKPGALRGARAVGVVLRRTKSDYGKSRRVFLDLGTNLDRERSVDRGLALLRERMDVIRVSKPYESEAYGPPGQPPFINLSVEVETALTPERLRTTLREIETAAGRVRTGDKFAPRTIDLDIILYGNRIERHDSWQIPHRQLETQRFVLEPLVELEPDRIHPLRGQTLVEMLAQMNECGPPRVSL